MVTPITAEGEWRQLLDGLPHWNPPKTPTIVISPHPDDETLAVGGLIYSLTSAQADVSVVAVTDGESAYENVAGLGSIREAEQTAALAMLGVPSQKIHRFRLVDSGLANVEDELIKMLLPLVRPETHIIAPWIGDFHPDHEVCGRAARAVAATTGAHLTYYFFWTWHRGTPATLRASELVSFSLSAEAVQRKNEALLCHRSQLEHPSGEPILPPNLLEPMQRPYEVFLPA